MSSRTRKIMTVLSLVLAVVIGFLGAVNTLECARTVDVVASLGGAFGAGAATVATVAAWRR
ncbi:MAG TPA: hypothetical protein VHQ65_06295 [Thermoanaerobaculia bacterium]|nr:hypothetical protein [Thermoanaerobaculia bacterium]